MKRRLLKRQAGFFDGIKNFFNKKVDEKLDDDLEAIEDELDEELNEEFEDNEDIDSPAIDKLYVEMKKEISKLDKQVKADMERMIDGLTKKANEYIKESIGYDTKVAEIEEKYKNKIIQILEEKHSNKQKKSKKKNDEDTTNRVFNDYLNNRQQENPDAHRIQEITRLYQN